MLVVVKHHVGAKATDLRVPVEDHQLQTRLNAALRDWLKMHTVA